MPRYREGVQGRFLLGAWLAFLLIAVPLTAEARHRHERRIHSITLRPDGAGSVISVTFTGRARPRLLRMPEPVVALALADVDNDGELDILVTSNRQGLLLWRNAGRGHFVLAGLPSRKPLGGTNAGLQHLTHSDEGLATPDDRYDAAMPRAPTSEAAHTVAAVLPSTAAFRTATVSARTPGRAPPTPSV
jgi:hypothetical protein